MKFYRFIFGLSLLFLLSVSLPLHSQGSICLSVGGVRGLKFDNFRPELKEIDSVRIRIWYNTLSVTDTVEGNVGKARMYLDIGDRYVKYSSELNALMYSLQKDSSPTDVLNAIARKSDENIWCTTIIEAFYFNMPEGYFTKTGRIGSMDFKYEEALPEIAWTIEDSVKSVGEYSAQKATCHYKGRDYVVWFTSEIPLPYGPWEFCGLPGLILTVSDTDGYYTFEFDKMSSSTEAMYFPEYEYIKTTGEKYMKMKRQIEADFSYYLANYDNDGDMKIIKPDGYKPKVLKNDFIERAE